MRAILQQMTNLMKFHLKNRAPVLSGNLKMSIETEVLNDHTTQIVLNAPFYDMKEWTKNKNIVYTGKSINGVTDYPYWLNKEGAFGKHNSSEGWTDRAIMDVVRVIAAHYGIPEKNIKVM